MVRKKVWILPGGKLEPGESDLECLVREIREELSRTQISKNIKYYNSFEGTMPYHPGNRIKVKVYFAQINGQVYKVREEDSISEAQWVDTQDINHYHLSEVTSKIINSLRREDYLG